MTEQKYLLPSAGTKRVNEESSEETLMLKITDPVSTDQSVTPNNVIVVFNAKFDHQTETGLTLICTNRNKKLGKAVSRLLASLFQSVSVCPASCHWAGERVY